MRKHLLARLMLAGMTIAISACGFPGFNSATPGTFSPTGSMGQQREGQTATLLEDGRVLIAGGTRGCCMEWTQLSEAELYDPARGTFSQTGSMTTARAYALATRLQDGRVLIADSTSAELYDPATAQFSSTGSPLGAPTFTTATLLEDGRVLLTGTGDTSESAPSELYDPKTGVFSLTGSLLDGCIGSSATLLNDGRVLFVGCGDEFWQLAQPDVFHDSAAAELYDPRTGSFSITGSMTQSRSYPTATLLMDGRVLVSGGSVTGANGTEVMLDTAEIYDPATGSFRATGAMREARGWHTATLLQSGLVLVTGGSGQDVMCLATAELFDPASGTFGQTSSEMNTCRYAYTATLLHDGRVLFAGGRSDDESQLSSAEVYNPLPTVPAATGG